MKIVCDNCSTKYSIADEKVRGKVFKIKCKKCSHIIVVKGQEGAAAAEAAPGQPAGAFDQKETRVFDYSGFEGKEGQAPGGDAIWHLVIDREQVGPLTVAEVGQKWSAGEIDADTYAWREGFGDWQRVAAIDELSSVIRTDKAPAAEDPRAGAGMFGGAAESGPTGRADPTDLFASAGAGQNSEDAEVGDLFSAGRASAAAADHGGGGAGVFASAPAARRSVPKEDLFSGGNGGAGNASADELAASDPSGRNMTGQRNENSVLFSLNNLAALATNEPAPRSSDRGSGGGGGGGGAQPGFASSSGSEGSGLIDIRAMAAMTLGSAKKDDRPRMSASEDDLPVFSSNSFSAPAAGVLLPTVSADRGQNKMVYVFMGIVGLLAIAAIILVVVILLGKKSNPTTTGDNPAQTTSSAAPAAGTSSAPAQVAGASSAPSTTGATSAPVAATASSKPAEATASSAPAVATASSKPKNPKDDHKVVATNNPPPEHKVDSKATATPPVTPPVAPPGDKKTPAQKCDEVACLVTPDLPCCPKTGGKNTQTTTTNTDPNLPDRLDQPAIIKGMQGVSGRVAGCSDNSGAAFKVKITVSADGSVTNATAAPPVGGTPAGNCVEKAVKGAHFSKTKNPITFNYPYKF